MSKSAYPSHDSLAPRSKVTLFAGGKELKTLSMFYLHTEQRVNGIPSAALELSIPGNAPYELSTHDEMALCQVGLPMLIKVYDDALDQQLELFSGVITASGLSITKGQAVLSLVIRHKLIQLDNVIRSQVFTNMDDNAIIRALCPADVAKIDNRVVGETDYTHEQKVQFRCSDWRMLRHRLDACGAWLIATPNVVKLIKPQLAENPDHHLLAKNGPLMDKASWQFSAVDQPASLTLTAWDIASQSPTSAPAQQCKLGSGAMMSNRCSVLNNTPWVMGYGTSPTVAELRQQSDSLLLSLQLKGAKGEFTVQGSTKYLPGQTLGLSGFGQHFDGSGIITAVMHSITPSRWVTTMMLGPSGLAPAALPFSQMSGILPGKVAQYDKKTKDKFYRIRIHLSVLGTDSEKNLLWARFAMPYATKGSSFICYPEPGDEVAVGFFDGNPDYPVIVGSLHNPQQHPAVEPGQDEGLKGWKTDEIQLQIDTRQHNLTLKAGDKSLLIIDKSKEINVSSDNGINISSGKKGVAIEGAEGVTIKGKNIDLTK